MALHDISDRDTTLLNLLKTDDLRLCRFYEQYMRTHQIPYEESLDNSDIPAYCERLNNALKARFTNEDDLFNIVVKIKREASQEVVPTKEFDWLRRDERACFWLWGVLRTASEKELSLSGVPEGFNYVPPAPYLQSNLNKFPISHQERFDLIVKFIDDWNMGLAYYEDKGKSRLYFLNQWKEQWFDNKSKKIPFKWLDKKNNIQCNWAWEYVQNGFKKNPEEYPNTNYLSPPLDKSISIYDALQAAYDVWSVHKDTQKLFLKNISKAWSQIKYHQKNKNQDNVPLNTYIKKNIKSKLNELARNSNKNIKDVLEYLIIKECDKKD